MDLTETQKMHFALSENLHQIFLNLNMKDLQACSCVCKEWNIESKRILNRKSLPSFSLLQFQTGKGEFVKLLKTDYGYVNDSDDDEDDEYFNDYQETVYPKQNLLTCIKFKPKLTLIFYDDTIHENDHRFNYQYIISRYSWTEVGTRHTKLFALKTCPYINYQRYKVCNNEIVGLFFPQNVIWAIISSEEKLQRIEEGKKRLLAVLDAASPNECIFLFFNVLWRDHDFNWKATLQEIGMAIWEKNINCWGTCLQFVDNYDPVYQDEILLVKFGMKNMYTNTLILDRNISHKDFLDELTKFKNTIIHELKYINTIYFIIYLDPYDHDDENSTETEDYIRIIRQTFENSNVFTLLDIDYGNNNMCFGFDYRNKNCHNFIHVNMMNLLIISHDPQ